MGAIERASVILIRYLLQTVFISVDMRIREGALFCNSLCDFKPPYTGQVICRAYIKSNVNGNSKTITSAQLGRELYL